MNRLDDEYGKFFYNADRPNKGMGTPVGSMVRDVSKASEGKFIPLGIAYPAVKVSPGSPVYPIEYRSSVDLGSHTVVTVLERLASYCRGKLPNVVLAGYSQGAHVIEDALAEINDSSPSLAALLKKVVLIASPIHRATGPENVGGAPTAGALIRTAKPGRAAFIAAHPGVVTSICRPGDLVCDASFADGLSDPSAFLGVSLTNSLGARIHTSYENSDIPCPVTDLQQFTTVCAANAVSQKLGWPLNRHVVSAPADPDSDRDHQYSTRPGQKVDVMYFLRTGASAGISKLVNVFMYSTPVKVGTVTIGDDGFGVGSITIPANAEPGAHKLVFRRDDGQTFTRSIVVGSSGDSELLLTLDGSEPDAEPFPIDPVTPVDPVDPDDGNGSLGGLFGS
ncbi:cutinase family protein [Gordonia spumicola]|uniref:cutinase family protein n=1 Tax=Gordonia spumicola TaxID=589161 RepID=UPI0013799A6F|nr:cutinase family protein [Gordonia spumicola]